MSNAVVSELRSLLNARRRTARTTADEERRLIPLAQAGDRDAMRVLVEANLPLVVMIALPWQRRVKGHDLSDLVAEGTCGLIEAVRRFDLTLGLRLGTFASHWILRSIRNAANNRGRLVRFPAKLARVSPVEALASLDAAVNRDGGRDRISDTLVSPTSGAAHRTLLAGELRRLIARILREDEAYVITRRFGLDGQCPAGLEEIAASLDRSRERIRQIEAKALTVLRVEVARRGRPLSSVLGVIRRPRGSNGGRVMSRSVA